MSREPGGTCEKSTIRSARSAGASKSVGGVRPVIEQHRGREEAALRPDLKKRWTQLGYIRFGRAGEGGGLRVNQLQRVKARVGAVEHTETIPPGFHVEERVDDTVDQDRVAKELGDRRWNWRRQTI